MVTYTNTRGNKYTGAGFMLFEQVYTRGVDKFGKARMAGPVVILYRNKRTGQYSDLGGLIDHADLRHRFPLAETARREGYEESSGYINFPDTLSLGGRMDGVDVMVDHREYRGYCICIPTGYFSQYAARKMIKHNNETDDVTRFFLSDLISANLLTAQGDLQCVDAQGTVQTIMGRTKALLRNAYQTQFITRAGTTTNLVQHVIDNPKSVHKFPDGTMLIT